MKLFRGVAAFLCILSGCNTARIANTPGSETLAAGDNAANCVVDDIDGLGLGHKANNFGSIPPQDFRVFAAPKSADESAELLSSYFRTCKTKVKKALLAGKAHAYVFFEGFKGAAEQDNSIIYSTAMVQWITKRDPNAIILAIGWDCQSADAAGHGWCMQKFNDMQSAPLDDKIAPIVSALGDAKVTSAPVAGPVIADQATQNVAAYNISIAGAIYVGAAAINHLQMTKVPKIHAVGYSIGANMVAELMLSDYSKPADVGFSWAGRAPCIDGGNDCRIGFLKKFHWGVGFGLGGWSTTLNKYLKEHPSETGDFESGGVFRFSEPIYNDKLTIVNRRSDPTGNSHDIFQRGFNTYLFGDYEYNGHEYSVPLLVSKSFVQYLDKFLETPKATTSREAGVVYDSAAFVEFDDCLKAGPCKSLTHFKAFEHNFGSPSLVTKTNLVSIVEGGVPYAPYEKPLAASFEQDSDEILALRSTDQQDLRGAVELHYKPTIDPKNSGKRSIFAYESCSSTAELAPRAFIDNGKIVFEITYENQAYRVEATTAKAKLSTGTWTHLAFGWELPTRRLAINPTNLKKYGQAMALALGLERPLPTTYQEQFGMGTMTIHANGVKVAESKLGKADSTRDCLPFTEVIGNRIFETNAVEDGFAMAGPLDPFWGYTDTNKPRMRPLADTVPSTAGLAGKRCKVFKFQNYPVFFGCKEASGPAMAQMDNIILIKGKPRQSFENIGPDGSWKNWSGLPYDSQPFRQK